MKYLVIIEETSKGFAAHAPDFDACVVTGTSTDEVERNMRVAMKRRLRELNRERAKLPNPRSFSQYIAVSV